LPRARYNFPSVIAEKDSKKALSTLTFFVIIAAYKRCVAGGFGEVIPLLIKMLMQYISSRPVNKRDLTPL